MCKLLKSADEFITVLCPGLGYRFFGSIATVSNTWREYSSKVKSAWVELHRNDGLKYGKKIPPRCLSGRWASHIKFLSFTLDIPTDQVVRVLVYVLSGVDTEVPTENNGALDENSLEDKRQYKIKMGKWKATTAACLQNTMWRLILNCVFPIHHIIELAINAVMSTKYKHGTLLELCWRKDAEIRSSFSELIVDFEQWNNIFLEAPPGFTQQQRSDLVGLVFWHCCQGFADYCRRLGVQFSSYDLRIFQLIKSHPLEDCSLRREVAKELRTFPDWRVCDTVTKLRDEYKEELNEAENKGTLIVDLWWFLCDIGEVLRCHTQDIEGCNNNIKQSCVKNPHMKLPTLSARIVIRRRLLGGSNGFGVEKLSKLKPYVDKLKATATGLMHEHEAITKDIFRFKTPDPIEFPVRWKKNELDDHKLWAAQFNKRWIASMTPNFQHVMLLHGDHLVSPMGFLLCCRHLSVGMGVCAEVLECDLGRGTGVIKIRTPLSYNTTVNLLSDLCDEVMNAPFHCFDANVWKCTWRTTADDWLKADIAAPQAAFRIDPVDIFLESVQGNDGDDGQDGQDDDAPGPEGADGAPPPETKKNKRVREVKRPHRRRRLAVRQTQNPKQHLRRNNHWST